MLSSSQAARRSVDRPDAPAAMAPLGIGNEEPKRYGADPGRKDRKGGQAFWPDLQTNIVLEDARRNTRPLSARLLKELR